MASVSRRVYFAQLAALACNSLGRPCELESGTDCGSSNPHRPAPKPDWFQDWLKVQREEEQRVLAMLRQHIGPDGDLKAAYRAYWDARNREHTRDLILML